jgi:hypothetical protein
MDEKYIVYWWNYEDHDPYQREFDSLTEAVEFFNYLCRDEDVGRASLRWGNTEIQGMITEQYLKESEV